MMDRSFHLDLDIAHDPQQLPAVTSLLPLTVLDHDQAKVEWRSTTVNQLDLSRDSHPKHAVARLLDARVLCRCDAKRENRARVDRVDHAIVPEAGRRVVRRAL
jgi:hypothetical protein